MTTRSISGRTRPLAYRLVAALLGATALCSAAHAQDAAPSDNPTINLVNALVKKHILSRAEADTMIAQAKAQADQVKAAEADAHAAQMAAQTATQTAQTAQSTSRTAIAAAEPASATPGTSVRYIPDFVKDQITHDVTKQVLADAKTEGLVAPDALPEWVRGIKLSGDFEFRNESRFFGSGNANDLVDVGAINSGQPYDPNNTNGVNPPIRNYTQDRDLLRIRARLAMEADIAPQLTFYGRVATGTQPNPDSTNQTLGGYFSDKGIWLDRAYVDIHPFKTEDAHLYLGRMANPFRLNELVWDSDVNLDGLAASYDRPVWGAFSAHVVGGAFPLSYADNEDPTTGLLKTSDAHGDKWLFAGQAGVNWAASSKLHAELDAVYYDYQNVAGALSPACLNTSAFCITDYSRPGYLQAGNTLFALRDDTTADPNNVSSPQYYGLASAFRIFDVSGSVDYAFSDNLVLNLTGHFARNMAYDSSDILKRGFNPNSGLSQIINNNETCAVALQNGVCPTGESEFKSGGDAWLIRGRIGTPRLEKFGDWYLTASYRHLDADALLDAFTDQDFHLGGTNAKGWTLEGQYGIFNRTSLGLRWMDTQEVTGPPIRIDLLQADLNVHF